MRLGTVDRRRFLALAAAVPLTACAHLGDGAEPAVTRLYVFGDSYSDTGYLFQDGNGPTAVAYLAERLGFPLSHPKAADWRGKSLNFARSGAPTGDQFTRIKGFSVAAQAKTFAEMVARGDIAFDPGATLFFVAGGLNDGRLATEQTRANLRETVLTLKSSGARRFRIARLPERIPGFSETARRLNPMLDRLPAELSRTLGVEARPSRWGAYFDDIIARPADYGLINNTDPCAQRGAAGRANACPTPEQYFYYHPDHPSTAVHRIVGARLYAELGGTSASPGDPRPSR